MFAVATSLANRPDKGKYKHYFGAPMGPEPDPEPEPVLALAPLRAASGASAMQLRRHIRVRLIPGPVPDVRIDSSIFEDISLLYTRKEVGRLAAASSDYWELLHAQHRRMLRDDPWHFDPAFTRYGWLLPLLR